MQDSNQNIFSALETPIGGSFLHAIDSFRKIASDIRVL